MRALRTFLIALPIALILSWQTAPAFWHGLAVAAGNALLNLVSGNVVYYVNPSGSSTSPCGVSGASTCQAGSDSNSCTTIGAPCQTFQHAVYLISQTWVWGINLGKAQIFLADGTFNEVVDFPSFIGIPKWCSTCVNGSGAPGVLEIIGDDTTPANVVIAATSGSCSRGGTQGRGGVLEFPGQGIFWLHGFTVTAVNEASGNYCADISVINPAYVVASGTMNYGTASNGAPIINLHDGGTYKMSFNSATMNVTAGTTRTGYLVDVSAQGKFYQDNSTINFVGSTTFTSAAYNLGIGAWVSTIETVTYTGTLTSTICMTANNNAIFESFNQGDLTETFASCTMAAGTRGGFDNNVGLGANVGGMIVSSMFGTNINAGSAPTVTTCGSGSSQVDGQSTDQSGHIVEGSGATACTLVFYNTFPLRPNCTVTPFGAASVVTNFTVNGSGASWTGFTVSNSGGAITFDYSCWHHY